MTYDPEKLTGEQVFALMDDAAQRMNDAMVAQAERVFTTDEQLALVEWFKQRNEQLREMLQMLDRDRQEWNTRVDADHATLIAKLEADHEAFRARMDKGFGRFSNVRAGLTWFAWTMFWVSGFLARGAWDGLMK